jgi:hypothetical protein
MTRVGYRFNNKERGFMERAQVKWTRLSGHEGHDRGTEPAEADLPCI